ncbi:MAG: hypothetical protein KDB22_05385 [Planctomycetales bacterium]|nr:hypothetical protein [Planctomycetales bacterium]
MPKYYAVCGSHALVVTADGPAHAAMRLVDEVLAPHMWIYDDESISDQDRRDHVTLEALLHLSSSVCVSQRGLGRRDCGEYGVPELLDEWHCLMAAAQKLFIAAGVPRRILPTVLDQQRSPQLPR